MSDKVTGEHQNDPFSVVKQLFANRPSVSEKIGYKEDDQEPGQQILVKGKRK